MISIEQWRARIGCFNPSRKKAGTNQVIIVSGQSISVGLRLVLALSLCIILAGDVEVNPGPTIDDVMTELKDLRLANDQHFNSLKNEISSLRTDMASIRKEVDIVKERVKDTTTHIYQCYDECYGDIRSVMYRLEKLERQVENHERYSRRDNLIFYDIPDEKEETNDITTDKLIKVLNEHTPGKSWSDSDFIRVHRIKSKRPGIAPIIARFARSESKFCALGSRKRLRDSGYGVANDLSQAQRDQLNEVKKEGKRGYWLNGKLHIDHSYRPGSAAAGRGQQTGNGEGHATDRPWKFGENRGGDFPHQHSNNNRRDDSSQQHKSASTETTATGNIPRN